MGPTHRGRARSPTALGHHTAGTRSSMIDDEFDDGAEGEELGGVVERLREEVGGVVVRRDVWGTVSGKSSTMSRTKKWRRWTCFILYYNTVP